LLVSETPTTPPDILPAASERASSPADGIVAWQETASARHSLAAMQVSLDLATAAAAHARLQADMRDQAAAASFKYQKLEKAMEAAAHRADMEHAAHAMQQTQQQTNKHSRKQPNTAAFCGMATNSEYSRIGVGAD
jgi:hypothetical protein